MNTRRAFINKAAGTVAAVAFTRCGLLGAASAQAQTRPSASNRIKTSIATSAPEGRFVNATANGRRKRTSTSKIRNRIA